MAGKISGRYVKFCDFIQVFVFTTNHHLNLNISYLPKNHPNSLRLLSDVQV